MLSLVVDTNLLFSAILKLESIISKIIIHNENRFTLYTPDYTLFEIQKHKSKLIKLSNYSEEEYDEIYNLIFHRVIVLNNNIIPNKYFKLAEEYCVDIDINDSIYVAYALYFNSKLWTGDKKLINGLKDKGLDITIDTTKLHEQFYL